MGVTAALLLLYVSWYVAFLTYTHGRREMLLGMSTSLLTSWFIFCRWPQRCTETKAVNSGESSEAIQGIT
jgi:hypothetical protein